MKDREGMDKFKKGMSEIMWRVEGLKDIERIEYELMEN